MATGRLSDTLSSRNNSLGLLRLVFASFVLISHAFPIGGFGVDPTHVWWNRQADISQIGLLGFFALSGYLITQSAQRRDPLQFLWARFLRIYPAYLAVLLVTALIIGPWAFRHEQGTLSGYWTTGDGGPLMFVINNLLLKQQQRGIHDIWGSLPHGIISGESVMNVSLWTLYWEFLCYFLIGALAVFGLLRRAKWIPPVLAIGLMVSAVVTDHVPGVGWTTPQSRILSLVCVFLIGASFRLYAHHIRINWRWATVAGLVVVASLMTAGFSSVGRVGLAYLVLWAGVVLPKSCHKVGAKTDLSYSIYIYAWPTAMALTSLGVPDWGYVPFVLLTFAIVVPVAAVSFHLIEKPSLRWKDRGPSAGIDSIRDRFRHRRVAGVNPN